MAEGTVHTGSPAKFTTITHRGMKKGEMYAIKQIKIIGWICQVHLGFGLSASAQVPEKTALAWVACPNILHGSYLV